MIRVGTAGWDYKDWDGIVYPMPRPRGFDPLRYLAGYLDVIEVNSTFYGPATAKTTRAWLERVGEYRDFRFTAKLWKRFTHDRGMAWSATDVDLVRDGFDPLMEAGKLGAVLLQFPWSFRNTEENREWLDDLVTAFGEYPLVVEVRHDSWLSTEFLKELCERGVGFVNIDQPQFADSLRPTAIATSAVGYVRVHGRNYRDWWRQGVGVEARYDYLYTSDELTLWVRRAIEIAAVPIMEDVFIITNNHFEGQAVANALMARSILGEAETRPLAPSSLIAAYPTALGGLLRPDVGET